MLITRELIKMYRQKGVPDDEIVEELQADIEMLKEASYEQGRRDEREYIEEQLPENLRGL